MEPALAHSRIAAVAVLVAALAACATDAEDGRARGSDDVTGPNVNPAQPEGIPEIRGYGALTQAGATDLPSRPHDVCTVTTLEDGNSTGSFRRCVLDRSGPREVRFAVAGTIKISRRLGIIVVRLPYLTINGFSAPPPGITVTKSDECFNAMRVGATHDVVIAGLRFQGLWRPGDPFPNPSCEDVNNTNTLGVDGDAGAVRASWDPEPNERPNRSDPDGQALNARSVRRIVLAYNTFANGHDSNPDYWGDIIDVTHQGNLVIDSWHPSTISYKQTSPRRSPRRRMSWYANVYARNGERQPQLVNGVYDFDMRDNVIYGWHQPGGGGYGLRFKGFSGDLATSPVNVIHNAFLAAGSDPDRGCMYGSTPKRDAGPDARIVAMRLFFEGNLFPEGRRYTDNCVTTASAGAGPYAVPARAQLPRLDWQAVVSRAGMPYRTSREQALLAEVATALAGRQ
jgi:hypothetical protein